MRSSEFWLAVIAAIGVGGAQAGIWTSMDFDKTVYPALVYIVGRLISKLAKSVAAPQSK